LLASRLTARARTFALVARQRAQLMPRQRDGGHLLLLRTSPLNGDCICDCSLVHVPLRECQFARCVDRSGVIGKAMALRE
jgi:hypothetical protein